MNRIHIMFLLFCSPIWAQTSDTLLYKELEEVLVAYTVPLNSENMIGFYQTNQFSSIDDINARMPGVSLLRRGSYAMEPQVGGFSGGQINVTIDGMHIFGACTDKMDPVTSYIETDNLQSINLSYGTNGNQFGSTIGGALNMQLLTPVFAKENTSSVGLGYGYESISEGHNTNLLWQFSQQRFAFRGNISYRNHQMYIDGNGNKVRFSQFSKFNLFGSAAYRINKNSYLQANAIYDEANDVGYPALPMDVATAQGQIYSVAYFNKSLGVVNNLEAKMYYNDIYHLMDDSKRDSLFFINNGADSVYMRMDMPGWSNTKGAYAQGDIKIDEKSKLHLKAEYYHNNLRADMTMFMTNAANPNEPPMFTQTWPESNRYVAGLFANYSRYLSDNIKVNATLSSEYSATQMVSNNGKQQFTVFGNTIKDSYNKVLTNGNINLKYHVSKHWQTEFGVGYGERLPTITEQFGFYLFNAKDGYDYIGQPDIVKEKAFQGNVAVSYHKKAFKTRYFAQWSHIKDYIYGEYKADIPQMNLYAQGTKQYINLNYANIFTNHLELLYTPITALTLMSVNQFTYGINVNSKALPQIAPLSSTNVVQWQKKKVRCNFEMIFSAKQNRIDTNYGETTTSAYTLFNVKAHYVPNIGQQQLELMAGIDNLTNKTYREHLDWGNFYRAGRSFTMQISYRF